MTGWMLCWGSACSHMPGSREKSTRPWSYCTRATGTQGTWRMEHRQPPFIKHLLRVRHCSKCFTCINSFSPHKIPKGRKYFCNLCSGEIETLGKLRITAWLISHRTGIWTQAVWLRACTASHDSLSVPVTLSWVPSWLSLATWSFQGCILVTFHLPTSHQPDAFKKNTKHWGILKHVFNKNTSNHQVHFRHCAGHWQ